MSILRMLLGTALILLPTSAFADAFSVFQVQGVFQDSGELLSGTLMLDTTSGVFTASSLEIYASDHTIAVFDYGPSGTNFFTASGPGIYSIQFDNYDPQTTRPLNPTYLILSLPMLPSAGQTPQSCTMSTPCGSGNPGDPESSSSYSLAFEGQFGQYAILDDLSTGQVTPGAAATITPEPSAFLLLETGLLAVGAVARCRLVC